jgi:hypothetical protein
VDALNPDQSKQWVYIPSLLITIKYQWFCVSIQISHLYVLLQSREQLIQISRIRGHYPQIFFVNNQRRATYVGNHEALAVMEDQGKLTESWLSHYAKNDCIENIVPTITGANTDSSFFSV